MVFLWRTRISLRLPGSATGKSIPRRARWLVTHSYVEGPVNPPLEHRTLPVYFREEIVGKHAERLALISRQECPRTHGGPPSQNMGVRTHLSWDFQEFSRHIDATARGLASLGVKKGDRVGVVMGNNSAYALLQWACASVGAILVTLNPAYRLPELVEALNVAGVSHLFVVPRIRTSQYVRGLSAAFPDLRHSTPGNIQAAELPSLRNLVVVDDMSDHREYLEEIGDTKCAIDFREMLVWCEDGTEQRQVKELVDSHHSDEVINLQFTSGTTGKPKAVSLTHLNILNNGLSIGQCMRLTADDILCNVPPLFHCFDESYLMSPIRLVLGNLAAWSHGACIVYPSPVFHPEAIVDAVVQERCTALHGVPTHFLGVLSEVQKRREAGEKLDLSCLRTGIAAGSPVPIDLMNQLINKLNLVDITIAYGMTVVDSVNSPVSFQTTPADSITKRVETVGRVQPHVKAKVIDREGEVVPVGTPGEICVTGYLLQKGYWENEEQTKKVMRADPKDPSTVWMHTGDEGIMDEDGYLRVVGRVKNLFPVQIENVLVAHPFIREAAAVSVPDAVYGEVVGVWIVLEPHATMTREEVRKIVSDGMNPQNSPDWVWFIGEPGTAKEFPKTASGKVMKHVLRAWSKELARDNVGKISK
ncbi:acetyl-CoA synthetase-like protein [Pisolithus croceorrhizus]|nr:acetyl-CoA synthetase-like protein [Pisolithus croceorrhizus]KAI6158572.1 acetyl-CoA synthetase-like protein [Pisolithus thermaeus]